MRPELRSRLRLRRRWRRLGFVGRGCGDGEELGKLSVDVQDGAAFDGDGFELARRHQRVDDVADARAGGDRREEGLDLLFGGDDGLAEIEGDERGERGRLSGVGSGLDLLGEAGGGQLPERGVRRRAAGWGGRGDAARVR